jgi:hypothetical protein
MNTLTLASIYESQGHKMDALEIYWNILEEDPENEAAKKAIERLGRVRKVFKKKDEKMSKMFVEMTSDSEFLEFQNWLVS